MIQKTINAVILGASVLIAVFWLLFVLLFFSGSLTFGAEPSLEEQLKQKDVYILRLEKKIAELQMQLLQEQLITVRDVWKEKVKALGEPDPDAPAKGNRQKQN